MVRLLCLTLIVLLLAGCVSAPETPETTPPTTVPMTTATPTTEPIVTGWVEDAGLRYFYDSDGEAVTGWQEIDGLTYYFCEDGAMATGQVMIDETAFHFTSQGQQVLVVNPWNYVPEGYVPDLVDLSAAYATEGNLVDRSCYEALIAMIDDCNAVCPQVMVLSSYRTQEHQTKNYIRKVNYYLNLGYSQEDAEKEAATIIAIPGTSEHQLGLAVDIIDTRLWALEEEQADLPAQQWLMENSWRYGFILRYPKDKIDETGIIYEPWHYRYVGIELATELHDLDLTLEAYLQNLTR